MAVVIILGCDKPFGDVDPVEGVRVHLRVGIEPGHPAAGSRHPDGVLAPGLGVEVHRHHDVVVRTTVSPAVEGVDVVVRVQVQGVDVLSGEALGVALLVETQTDEIAVHPEDALELSALIPMQRDGVAEPFALQELLALEDHRQTR